MRAGWMRPSCRSFSRVMRATSRRTPSKALRTTALGVSSMMKSTPVRFSRARMLRPSRPMMRPFMSSLGSCTTETVVSAAWLAARRCMATERIERTRRSASRLVSSSTERRILTESWRAWSSTSLSSACLAWPALRPATRSSARSCSSRRWASSSSWAARRSTCASRSRSRASSSADRRSSASSSDRARSEARASAAAASRCLRSAAAGASACPPLAVASRPRYSVAAATRPIARTAAAITISIACPLPARPGWRPAQTVFFRGSWGGRPAARAVEPGRRWLAAAGAALQVRWRCAEWMGVDGRARPGEAFMMFASKLKLPITEIR